MDCGREPAVDLDSSAVHATAPVSVDIQYGVTF
jgi:hypothetical protein